MEPDISASRDLLCRVTKQIIQLESGVRIDELNMSQTFGVHARFKVAERMSNKEDKLRLLRGRKELIEQKLIEERQIGDEMICVLTKKGVFEALRQRIVYCDQYLPQGQRIVVTFDIPENLRDVRQSFRRLLKQAGFSYIHLSVWESQKSIMEDLAQLVKALDCDRWIRVYYAVEIA
ncbi:hypothetical protein ACFLZY_01170 [Patescibacteria group bacterium]